MPRYSVPALASLAPKRKQGRYARWHPTGARLVSIVMDHVMRASRGLPRLDISAPREPAWLGRSRGSLASYASRGLAPREGIDCLVDEDGPYRPASTATPWAAARHVWGPPFPKRRQEPPGSRCARAWLRGEAKGQARSAVGPKILRPRLTRGGRLDVGVSAPPCRLEIRLAKTGLLPLVCLFQRHGNEAGKVQVRLERRSRVSRKQRDWGSQPWAMDE